MGRYVAPIVLAAAFAAFAQLCVVLGGSAPAAPVAAVVVLGALVVALVVTPAPFRRVRSMSRAAVLSAAAGGIMAVFGAPALVLGLRMSDAPAGSIVVFLMSGGWAAIAAVVGASLLIGARRRLEAAWSASGALLVLAGAAGVVACWERPSSFSPFVRFAMQEWGMLVGGVLFVVGGLLLVRAARASDAGGALICGSAAAAVVGILWLVSYGPVSGLSALAGHSVAACLAAACWGVVCYCWLEVLRNGGPALGAASLALAPVLITALTFVEQTVGVAGPQPLVVTGVIAGSVVVATGCTALVHSVQARARVARRPVAALAVLPIVPATIALMMPAIAVGVAVAVDGGDFAGSWTLSGAESIAGWCVVALAVLVCVMAWDPRPHGPAAVSILAFGGIHWLADVPTHVWSAALAPEIQVYYGTPYGSITFTSLSSPSMIAAVGLGIVALLAIMVVRRAPVARSGKAVATTDGGT